MAIMNYPIEHLGGRGQLVHIAPANGFPIETYTPLTDALLKNYQVIHLPPRGVWEGEQPPTKRINWKNMVAKDLIAGIEQHQLTDLIGIGHSFGGVATLLTGLAMPQRFKAIILLDPTIFHMKLMWMMWLSVVLKQNNPLAKGANRRRDHFDSYDDADQRLRKKAIFADWDEQSFQGYIDSMRVDPAGGVRLKWAKQWEAYYFNTIYTNTWRDIPKLKGKFPILTIRGGTSDTLSAESGRKMQKLLPDMVYHEIDGHGHLFPQSAPHQTAQIIEKFLSEI
jgi:pimeloyl-ACP methyl ester carboxylesterase